jgi:hypothetical protein
VRSLSALSSLSHHLLLSYALAERQNEPSQLTTAEFDRSTASEDQSGGGRTAYNIVCRTVFADGGPAFEFPVFVRTQAKRLILEVGRK